MPDIDYIREYYRLRKSYLEKTFGYLNDMQRRAVFTAEGPLLVLAGAGSGKTTVLVSRIAYLLCYGNAYESLDIPDSVTPGDIERLLAAEAMGAETLCEPEEAAALFAVQPAPAWSILAITFTNKAAAEMKERIRRAVGSMADEVWASTFHAMCVRMLRRYADRLGYDTHFTIYDTDDQTRLMKDVMKDLNVSTAQLAPKAVLSAISRAKDSLLSPENYRASVGADYRLSIIAKLYESYQKRLRAANAMDFDDLIVNTVQLLENEPEVLAFYHRKFRYVLVDEYQDTNYAQYKLTSLLAAGSGNLCVVGDDDQSIYRFRGATIRNILDFEKEYPTARVVKLEQNYRSTGNILSAANAVIANNRGRKGKALWTAGEDGDKIICYTAEDEVAEANYIAEKILESVAKGGRWSDNAVLYRMNAQSNAIERALRENAVPYRMVGGTRFYDRAEIRDVLSYLQVIANPSDELRLARIINVPARGISDSTLEKARTIAAESGLLLVDVLRNASAYPALARPAKAIARFFDMIDGLYDFALSNDLPTLYDTMLEATGYRQFYELKNDDEAKSRLENIEEMKSNLVTYVRTHEEPSLEDFLSEVSLISDIDKYDAAADAAVLMTVHNAKGLEFPNVFLCGMEEDIFPSYRSTTEQEDLEEERRLCYVGITRAKASLTMLCARRRMLFGRTTANAPSRFIEEIPRRLVQALPQARRTARNNDPFVAPRAAVTVTRRPAAAGMQMPSAPNADISLFKAGLRIHHSTFGPGKITSALPMGGDMLLTIAFDDGTEKKFMAKTAAKYISFEA